MKKYLNKYVYLSIFIALSMVITSCSDDDTLEADASKVVPLVTAINGKTVAFVNTTESYSVSPYRGGSNYIWSVTGDGATIEPISGRTDKINVRFAQFGKPVALSVYEEAYNGAVSAPKSFGPITVFGSPCDWTVEMTDLYGDGWNGASVSFTFDGISGGSATLAAGKSGSKKIAVPNGSLVKVKFNSGDWDEEVVFKIYDGSGTLVYEGGPTPPVGQILSVTNNCPI